MSGDRFLLDTNVLLYFFAGDKQLADLINSIEIQISVITELELLLYPRLDEVEESRIKSFINDCAVLNLSHEIKESAILLRRKHLLKIPDAIIAATFIVNQIPLLTSDSDFMSISGLEVVYYERS